MTKENTQWGGKEGKKAEEGTFRVEIGVYIVFLRARDNNERPNNFYRWLTTHQEIFQ